ncbi:glutamate synthase-related protein [Candidatus Coxiella mudrowiae]|uniref:glutamate synthase-related protein n=1 Tax=Candidatus Coxiella mudrowiae TaxID=2054173 RepID=UPI001F20E341|nr:glutamate synthase-related protein [Candidatus Coxiella mudrowiae]
MQSHRCHLNICPTGVTTQDPKRRYALHIDEKAIFCIKKFHESSLKSFLESFLEVLGVAGLEPPRRFITLSYTGA